MTPERLEELHLEAVLDQVRREEPGDHEKFTRLYIEYKQERREEQIQALGKETLLELHYRDGGPHPHDYPLPLNMWEDVPD